jgi:hypothetical protein
LISAFYFLLSVFLRTARPHFPSFPSVLKKFGVRIDAPSSTSGTVQAS